MSGGAQRRVGLGYGAGDADVSSPFSTFFFFPFFYILLNEIYDEQSPQSPFPITTPECGPRHGSLCDHAVPSPHTLVMADQTGWVVYLAVILAFVSTPECGQRYGSLCDHAVPSPRMLVMAEQTGFGWSDPRVS